MCHQVLLLSTLDLALWVCLPSAPCLQSSDDLDKTD